MAKSVLRKWLSKSEEQKRLVSKKHGLCKQSMLTVLKHIQNPNIELSMQKTIVLIVFDAILYLLSREG